MRLKNAGENYKVIETELENEMAIRVCIDVGGTFTDLAMVRNNEDQLYTVKVSSTPDDSARGVVLIAFQPY